MIQNRDRPKGWKEDDMLTCSGICEITQTNICCKDCEAECGDRCEKTDCEDCFEEDWEVDMERLTARDKYGHAYYPKCFEHPCEGERKCCTYTTKMDCSFEDKVLDKLAAYEDTGLTPLHVGMLKNRMEFLEQELKHYKDLAEQEVSDE